MRRGLIHQKSGTVLEQYEYEYDLLGNRTALQKDRRASVFASVTERLASEESGNYIYRYDNLDRLTEVLKDGKLQSRYRYDAYGNRTEKETGEGTTHYAYNEADQLVREEGPDGERTFHYDFMHLFCGVCVEKCAFQIQDVSTDDREDKFIIVSSENEDQEQEVLKKPKLGIDRN